MSNVKYRPVGIKTLKDKNDVEREVTVLTVTDPPPKPCKYCKERPRMPRSSGCEKCSKAHKAQMVTDAIVQQRKEQAIKKQNEKNN